MLVKVNAIDLLRKELPRKRVKGTIGTGSMSDPYLPLEATRNLTGQALEVIAHIAPDRAWFTHLCHDFSHEQIEEWLARNAPGKKIEPAFDGLRITIR